VACHSHRMLLLMVTVCVAASACNRSGVTTPSTSGSSYTGEWSGTTSQGAPISFSVSADQTVTSITVGYKFNGCSGTSTFANVSLKIPTAQSPFPPRVPTPIPGFGYGSGPPEGANYIQVVGIFPSDQTSTGSLAFLNFSNCGNAVASWNATRH
jgi:hypothetical protein